jgi:hypothetical protein
VVEAPGGELVHFDILGYVLVCTTAITLVMMYFIERKMKGDRAQSETPAASITAPEPVPVPE